MHKNTFNALRLAAAFTAAALCAYALSRAPFTACAVEIGVEGQEQIEDYFNAGYNGGASLVVDWTEDEDGNRSGRLEIVSLQNLALQEQARLYEGLDFSAAPSTFTVGGQGFSGVYISRLDGKQHIATGTRVMSDGVFVSSDEFSVSVSIPWVGYGGRYVENSGAGFTYQTNADQYNRSSQITITASGGYFTSGAQYYQSPSRRDGRSALFDAGSPPTLSAGLVASYNSNSSAVFGAYGVQSDLPGGTFDSSRPWDYYNNVLLPYIRSHYNDIPDWRNYVFFPDGYSSPVPDLEIPTEVPTLPGFDIGMEESGTLPSDTSAWELPEIPTKAVPVPGFDLDSINPARVMAPVADGLRGIWYLISDTLTSLDLLPVVAVAFLVLIITALLGLGV